MNAQKAPKRRSLDATDLARVAVFAALVAVLGMAGSFSLPGGVPITAQTLGVMLAGAILGPYLGALSMAVLIALVAAGLPLMSGGRGGIAVLFGPSGGYILGWIASAFVIGAIVHTGGRKPVWWRTLIGIIVGGIIVEYAIGIPLQAAAMHLPLDATAKFALAFLPGDLIKSVIATLIVGTLVRAYPRAFRRQWRAASVDASRTESAEPARTQ